MQKRRIPGMGVSFNPMLIIRVVISYSYVLYGTLVEVKFERGFFYDEQRTTKLIAS
jgi:hypothetical protein